VAKVCVCAGHFPPQRQLLLDPLLESTVRDEPRSIVSERGPNRTEAEDLLGTSHGWKNHVLLMEKEKEHIG
jgi:hypothetical protein